VKAEIKELETLKEVSRFEESKKRGEKSFAKVRKFIQESFDKSLRDRREKEEAERKMSNSPHKRIANSHRKRDSE